ncbi:MAG: pitrilysin family protein [Deltaproteobacteria bacterium]|nr:pitrilysin family protein [Deltaproteobacteria bacterium]
MKRSLLALMLVASSSSLAAVDRSAPPVPGPVPAFTMPVPVELTLKNGLKVYFLERHRAPLVDVVAVIGSGALADPTGQEGTAIALAELLTQGAGDKDAFAFDDAVKALGADIGASASWTGTFVTLHATSARFAAALPLWADVLLRPRLTADDWERKRGEKLGELAYYKDEPRMLGNLAAARTLFGSERPGTSLMGTPKSLTKTKVEDLRAFHARHFRPDNAFLVVAGEVDRKALVAALEAALSSWTPPAQPLVKITRPEPAPIEGVGVVVVDRPGAPQTAVSVVSPVTTTLKSFDAPSAVMQTLLGGSFTSRLNTNLREVHGYSYGAGYSLMTYPWHRSIVSTNVATAKTLPALDEIFIELARIREPATTEEIERARAYEALSFPAILDGGRSLASAWASWKEQGVPNDVVTGYMGQVTKVDVAAAAASAVKLVDPKTVRVVVVGDKASLGAGLAKLGAITSITADELLPAP